MSQFCMNYSQVNALDSTLIRLSRNLSSLIDRQNSIKSSIQSVPSHRNHLSDANYFITAKQRKIQEKVNNIGSFRRELRQFTDKVSTIDSQLANEIKLETKNFRSTTGISLTTAAVIGAIAKKVFPWVPRKIVRLNAAITGKAIDYVKDKVKSFYVGENGVRWGRVLTTVAIGVVCILGCKFIAGGAVALKLKGAAAFLAKKSGATKLLAVGKPIKAGVTKKVAGSKLGVVCKSLASKAKGSKFYASVKPWAKKALPKVKEKLLLQGAVDGLKFGWNGNLDHLHYSNYIGAIVAGSIMPSVSSSRVNALQSGAGSLVSNIVAGERDMLSLSADGVASVASGAFMGSGFVNEKIESVISETVSGNILGKGLNKVGDSIFKKQFKSILFRGGML